MTANEKLCTTFVTVRASVPLALLIEWMSDLEVCAATLAGEPVSAAAPALVPGSAVQTSAPEPLPDNVIQLFPRRSPPTDDLIA